MAAEEALHASFHVRHKQSELFKFAFILNLSIEMWIFSCENIKIRFVRVKSISIADLNNLSQVELEF
ncbi:MAG: hypothetical protein AB8A40_06140 [Prochlorococcus sp.]|jgi:hypothetical protein|nr:hypothetical protein [Prochlorococcaceae cyanobacterium ETNP14_MAG_4]|tara:strand:- start:103 stop:303 length:201 start_codon:yes stop_codon:yes gene_type:complete